MSQSDTPDATRGPESAIARLSDGADRVIETSCAVVILKGDEAYKIKKSVDFGFLDFSSRAKRKAALERELILNRETAADIYKRVETLEGEAVLVMRRFETEAVLDQMRRSDSHWQPDLALSEKLGERAARFHAGAHICTDPLHAANTAYVIGSNSEHIARFRQELGPESVDAYAASVQATHNAVMSLIQARFDQGFVRRCHGDMHLGNILIEDDQPVLFDCIEFNERLSQIDVLYDLAFLLMDLWVAGYCAAANQVLNRWLEVMARHEGEAVYDALILLPLYMSMRAAVRCHVNAHSGNMDQARIYLKAARDILEPKLPQLWAVGGLSGSGKSTRARDIAPDLGRVPGAIIVRSDDVRKRLHGADILQTLPPSAYTAEAGHNTYEALFRLARQCVRTGQSVIMDATFRNADDRQKVEQLAAQEGIAFRGLWLDVPAGVRAERVRQRTRDASDATAEIALSQGDSVLPTGAWEIEGTEN